MKKYSDVVINQFGQPVANVQVTVLVYNSSTLATLYSDNAGTVQTSNPTTTGADGSFSFYVPDGRYTLAVSGTGIASTQQTDIEIADITGTTNTADLPLQATQIVVPQLASAPALSAPGSGKLYFDQPAQKFRFSENGSAFQNAFGASGAGGHALLDGNIDNDTVLVTPTLGDIIAVNASSKWDHVPGNTTTTRKFLRQTGTGTASALPAWDTLQLGDIPSGVELQSNKGVANGYAGLNASTLVPTGQLGSGTANSSVFLRGDGSWASPPSSNPTFNQVEFLDTTSHTVSNTVTETNGSVCNFSAGATNVLNRIYRVRSSGIFSTTGTPTLRLKILIVNVVTLGLSKTFTCPSGASNLPWWIDVEIVRTATGATGTTAMSGVFAIGGLTVGSAQLELQAATNAGATWDATVAQGLTISFTWGTASASNSVTQNYFKVSRDNN